MIRNLLLAIVSLIVALGAGELALRTIDRFQPLPYPPVPRRPELYEPHARYGYALRASQRMEYEYPPARPRRIEVVSNRHGLRSSRELDEADPRPRVLITGDSFVFGEGVPQAGRFTDLLETSHPEWRVDNLGMPGWGVDHMLMAVEAVAEEVRPDVVVVALFYDDFRRVRPRYAGLGYPSDRYRLADGALERVPYPRPSWWQQLHLYEGVATAILGRGGLLSAPTEEEWALNGALLDRIRTLGDVHGYRTALVYLPGPWKGEANEVRRQWVIDYGRRHGVPAVDLTDSIHRDSAGVFLPENAHYNEAGHAVVARQLGEILAPMLNRQARLDRTAP